MPRKLYINLPKKVSVAWTKSSSAVKDCPILLIFEILFKMCISSVSAPLYPPVQDQTTKSNCDCYPGYLVKMSSCFPSMCLYMYIYL